MDHLNVCLTVLADYDLLLVIWLPIARKPSVPWLTTGRDRVIAQVIERVLVWTLTLVPSFERPHVIGSARRTHQVIRRPHRSVACVSSRNPNHPVNILLNIFHKPLDHIHLARATEYEPLNGVIDLLLVLANAAHL